MKFYITTEYDDAYAEVAALTIPVMEEYANRHGYGLLVEHNPKCDDIIRRRYETLSSICRAGQVDWAVHLDADVLLTNHKVQLHELVEEAEFHTRHPRIIMSECPYKNEMILNDGVALFKATRDNMLECLAAAAYPVSEKVRCGQDYFSFVSVAPITLLPQWKINGMLFKSEYKECYPDGQWMPGSIGSFALHLAGMRNDRRVELLKEYLPKIVR